MLDQFMQVEMRVAVVDLDSGERHEVTFVEECHELNDKSWGEHTQEMASRVSDRAARMMDVVEADRLMHP